MIWHLVVFEPVLGEEDERRTKAEQNLAWIQTKNPEIQNP